MAQERIDIRVSENGSRTVRRNLQDIGRSGGEAARGVQLLQRALLGLGVAATLVYLQRQVDTYTNIINRLRLVTSGTQNLARVNDELFASANRTRQSYDSTVTLYGKLAMGTRNLGTSQQELLGITETVNQAITLSGAATAQADAAMLQFGQALAGGIVRAEEFNSIVENTPRLAQALADGITGGNIGELRKLVNDGKVTSQQVVQAMQQEAAKLRAEFESMTPTIAQAFTVLSNNVVNFIGRMNEATGIAGVVANAIMTLAEHLDGIAILAAGVAVAFAWNWIAGAVMSVILPVWQLQRALGATSVMGTVYATAMRLAQGATRAFTAALLANPFTAILVVLTMVIAAIVEFGDTVSVTADGAVSLKDAFFAALSFIGDAVRYVSAFFVEAWSWATGLVTGLFAAFGTTPMEVLQAIWNFVKATVNGIIGLFVACFNVISVLWNQFPGVMELIFNTVVNAAAAAAEAVLNVWQAPLRGLIGLIGAFDEGMGASLSGALDNLNVTIPRRQLRQNGAEAGEALREGVTSAFTRDYVGEAGAAIIARARQNAGGGAEGALGANPGGGSPGSGAGDSDRKRRGGREETRPEYLARLNREHTQSIALAQMLDSELRGVQESINGFNENMREKGWALLSPTEEATLRSQLTQLREAEQLAETRDAILDAAREPQREWVRTQTAANQLLAEGLITAEQYGRALRDGELEALDANEDLTSGLRRGTLRILGEIADEASRVEGAMVSIWQDARGPRMEFEAGLSAVSELLRQNRLDADEARRAVRDLHIAFLETRTDLASGLEAGRLSVERDRENVGSRAADAYRSEWEAANQGMLQLQARFQALRQLMIDDPINSGRYAMQLRMIGVEALNLRIQMGQGGLADSLRAGLWSLVSDFQGIIPGLTAAWGDFFSSFADGFANSIGRAIVYSENLGESLGEVARSAMAELISALVKMGIQWLVMQTIGQASQAAIAATGAATGAATAAAWAPAAAAVSLATFGANAGPAMAGIGMTYGLTQALSMVKGFRKGGYTGGAGVDDVAGVVHGQEFVMNANATSKYRGILEMMNAGHTPVGFKDGGFAGPSGGSGGAGGGLGIGSVKVTIEDHVGATYKVERVSREEIRIIAREEVASGAPKAVAADMSKPSSPTSRAVERRFNVERKR